jgi:hypothetical protein
MDYSNTRTPTEIIDALGPFEVMPPDWASPGIDQIVAAVRGRQPKIVPLDLNRFALWQDLEHDINRYKVVVTDSGTPWEDKVPQLKKLDRILSSVAAERWPTWPRGLSDLQTWCRSTLADIEHGSHPELRVRNPIDWLVGYLLPKTFEKHFKRPAAATSTGPYARFAVAVLKEFRIKKSNDEDYEGGTIGRALEEVDKGLIRYKGQRVPQAVMLQKIPPKPHIPVVPDDDDRPPF